jgi:hypothetical protein
LWEQAVASQVPTAFNDINGFHHVDIGGNCIFLKEKTAEYYKRVIEVLVTNKDKYEALKLNATSSRSRVFLYSSIADIVLKDVEQHQTQSVIL